MLKEFKLIKKINLTPDIFEMVFETEDKLSMET
jgi:hypothetical protein